MKRFLFLLLFIPSILFGADLTPTGWVNDYTGLLTTEQVNSLNNKIANFEKQTDIELTFAIVSTLEDRDIESYANELFKKWGVGKADRNNGLLVVIAPNERKWRVEVGYGLEAYLTDYQSQELAEDNFKPNFRAGDYFAGIDGFVDATTKHLGTSTWEDRMAYKVKQEKASHEAMVNFWWSFLYVVLSIIGIVLFVYLFIQFKRKREEALAFKAKKDESIDLYKSSVGSYNVKLRSYKLKEIAADVNLIKSINGSLDVNELRTNLSKAIDSLKPTSTLVETLSTLSRSIPDLERKYSELSRKEESAQIDRTPKYDINKVTYDTSVDINQLQSISSYINRTVSSYNTRMETIEDYIKVKSVSPISLDYVDRLISKNQSRLNGEYYQADENSVSNLKSKLKGSILNFNSKEVTFDNLSELERAYESHLNVQGEINQYFDKVVSANTQRTSMIRTLDNSNSTLNTHRSRLSQFINNSDVSSSTKTMIGSFIAGMVAFKVTSDILSSFNSLSSVINSADSLARKAQSEIDEEERKRRKKREDQARKKREEEEEDDRRRRASYASSSSSWSSSSSSSDSGSSFGGFGGGDSGGGGSSGDW